MRKTFKPIFIKECQPSCVIHNKEPFYGWAEGKIFLSTELKGKSLFLSCPSERRVSCEVVHSEVNGVALISGAGFSPRTQPHPFTKCTDKSIVLADCNWCVFAVGTEWGNSKISGGYKTSAALPCWTDIWFCTHHTSTFQERPPSPSSLLRCDLFIF
jgi:hypothetical protein